MSRQRWLPHTVAGVSGDEEEAVALLSSLADDLLTDYYRQVAALRARAHRWSRVAFAVAFLLFALFLAQDFEFAPIPLLAGLALATLAAFVLGLLLRTRLVEPRRFSPPRIRLARKVAWQWVAMPLGEGRRVVLWDTLLDEATPLDLPANPPKRDREEMAIFETVAKEGLRDIEDEKLLIRRMGSLLEQWEEAPTPVRLPHIAGDAEPLLDLLMELPPLREWEEPPPPLPLARPLEQGRHEMQQLMAFHRTSRIFLQHLDSWRRSLGPLRTLLERQILSTRPQLEAPPAPPHGHPSGDVESLIGTLESVRASAIAAISVPLQEELARIAEEKKGRLRIVDEDLERKRDDITINSDALIKSFERQVEEMEKYAIPDTESSLKQAQQKQAELEARAKKIDADLTQKRKDLLLVGQSGGSGPRASEERKKTLQDEIFRLQNELPGVMRAVEGYKEAVETHRRAHEREVKRLEALQADLRTHRIQRDDRVRQQEAMHRQQKDQIESDYLPDERKIAADLHYFSKVIGHFTDALEDYRVDLVMEDESRRPYRQVFDRTQSFPQEKLAAIQHWNERIHELIEERRRLAERLLGEVESAALRGDDPGEEEIFYLPVWYVETVSGTVELRPRGKRTPVETLYLLAPLVEEPDGRRIALRRKEPAFMRPHPKLQERLDIVLNGPRREEVLEAARRDGRPVLIEPELLSNIAVATEMPHALMDAIRPSVGRSARPGLAPLVAEGAAPAVADPAPAADDALPDGAPTADATTARIVISPPPATDEFIPSESDADDAWEADPLSPDEGYEDAWDPEGVERRA